jgi:glutamyl-tRNA reductase
VILFGASFKDIPLTSLEILETHAEKIRASLFDSKFDQNGIKGGVVVSTCNRFEIYLDSETPESAISHAIYAVSSGSGLDTEYCRANLKILTGADAVRHLFRVTVGLDSMVVGEAEIGGQIGRALARTREFGTASRITEALFQRAANVSKKISTKTGLGTTGRSLITSALTLIKENHFDLHSKKVLVIGTGAYARVVIAALTREGANQIFVYSPSGRAEEFSQNHPTTPIGSDEIGAIVRNADLIVTCSGIHGIALRLEHLRGRKEGFLPIIDLSLSPDIEPGIDALPNVVVIDLDEIHRRAPKEHQETVDIAERFINEAVIEFLDDLAARANDPFVRALRGHVDEVVSLEVDRVRKRSGNAIAEQVHRSLQVVTKTIFHKPTVYAKAAALRGKHDEYQQAIQLLFGLNVNPSEKYD